MSAWQPVIGLEVHAQLRTRSKLFCACANEFGAAPNSRCCPICLGLPGALPRPNAEAIRLATRFALAIEATVHPVSIWSRKSYFYPDLPKGYQISQFDRPIATAGRVRIELPDRSPRFVAVKRVHLEEDAGKSVHEGLGPDESGIDLNRCGVPLIEIVTEPDLTGPDEAFLYLERLKSILRATGVCDADMEKGFLRCDANVSVRQPGSPLGMRVEIKNLNSFRHVRRALSYEIERQSAVLAGGGEIAQETRLWDEHDGSTRTLRGKEDAHDYRYFPEPDLPPLVVDESIELAARQALPELPHQRRDRYVVEHHLPVADAHRLTVDHEVADFFDRVVAACGNPRAAANWTLTEWLGQINDAGGAPGDSRIEPEALASLIEWVERGVITQRSAKEVFIEASRTGAAPQEIVERRGLRQIEDSGQIEAAARAVLAESAAQVEQYRAGKSAVLGFLLGQLMKRLGGQVNPARAKETLERFLAELM